VRADETGPGTGLGLAIAAEIAEAAGGVLELEEAGPGLSATLVLPLA
ncbi:MAG: sensor histidine kinase, partial [Paracoccaceae bacterium]